jgi:hypothetical protein
MVAGEWLQYTTYINDPGFYSLKLRVASPVAANSLSVSFAGSNVTGTVTFAGTGGNQAWTTITNTVFLTPGQQTMQVNALSSGFNLNWAELSPIGTGLLTNGSYKIMNRNSGKAMELAGAATTNGASIDQMPFTGGSHQKWTLTHKGANQYVITSGLTSSKAIDESSYNALSGDYIQTWTSASPSTSNQRWLIMPADSGYFKIMSANSGLVLETVAGANTNGAIIDQSEYTGGGHQQWAFLPPVMVNTAPTNLSTSFNGTNFILAWPADYIGWHLQAQTNSLATGLRANWVNVTNTVNVNSFTTMVNTANGTVFYRLTYP